MPLTRYQIRNEYSLADPELYRAADKDDPEALLEGVAMAGLVGVLRQLGDLAEFAAEIFRDLHEEVMATAARGHGLMVRVQQLEAEVPSIEKAFLSQTNHSLFFSNAGIDWHPNLHMEQNLVTRGDLPRFVMDSYEECRGPPRLFLLDKFDVAGAGACLKRYTDPSFFKVEAASSTTATTEVQREKKNRKVKKKGSRWRNGETPEVHLPSHAKLHQLFQEERIENGFSDSARLVKLKRRQLNGSPYNSKAGKSYMEKFLETPTPEQKVIHEIYVTSPMKLTIDDSSESGLEILEICTVSPGKKPPQGKDLGYSIPEDKPPLKRQSKKLFRKKSIKTEKRKVDKAGVEKAKANKAKVEAARTKKAKIEKARAEKGKTSRGKKPSKATSPKAKATEVLMSDVPASTPGISPNPQSKPRSEVQPCSNVSVLEDPSRELPTLPKSSLAGRSFTGIKEIPHLEELLASVNEEFESNDLDSAREPQVPKKLMGDAIKTGGEGPKGVGPRFKTLATRKHQSTDHGKGKHLITSKRPRYEDMSRKVCSMLWSSHESYPYCAVPILSSFLNPSAEVMPFQMDTKIHNLLDNSELDQDEREGAADPRRPTPQTQNFRRVSLEPRPIVTETPLEVAKQSARDIPESAPASSTNPASGAVPSVQSPLTSPKGDRKLPIHSLKDGLLRCPLQALQALAPERLLSGGSSKDYS